MKFSIRSVTKTTLVTTVLALALAVSAAAAPEHGDRHPSGRPGGHIVAPRARVVAPRHVIVRRSVFFDPFWGPYPYWDYPYPYVNGYSPAGELKTKVTPKQTQVYVDGYYAGVADNFDGTFQHLRVSPGGHEITLRLDGYRTVTQDVYVGRGSTYKLTMNMEKLAAGEVSEPAPAPARSNSTTPAPGYGSSPQQ